MSFSTISAIVLIIGALAIIAFIIHGIWFSGKTGNHKLQAGNPQDAKLLEANHIGKVRIVKADLETAQIKIDDSSDKDTIAESDNNVGIEAEAKWAKNYDFNIVASQGQSFHGLDIENIMNQYGFVRGDMDIYYVYENPEQRLNEVFRICSLKAPYSFPADMRNFTTPAMALFMNLPERGKGVAYIRAMRMAANLFAQQLGGTIQDSHHNIITDDDFDKMEDALAQYDAS